MEIGSNLPLTGQVFSNYSAHMKESESHAGISEYDRSDLSLSPETYDKPENVIGLMPRGQTTLPEQETIPPGIMLSLTDSQKTELSQKVLEDVKLKSGFYVDKTLTGYLQGLVGEIKSAILPGHPQSIVRVLNSDEENAFVTLDEAIYITKGLLKRLDTEEELLAVFAHELGHVKGRHIEKEYEKSEEMQKEGVNRLIKFVVSNEYSKECEFQADSSAVDAMIKLGRDPAGVRGLFGKFKEDEDKVWNDFREGLLKDDAGKGKIPVDEKEREEKERKADKTVKTVKTVERFLKTHPYASERLERACKQITSDLDGKVINSQREKKCQVDEEGFIRGLTGSFEEKLSRFRERYPDGRAGRMDEEAQLSLFKYGRMDHNVYDFQDERGSKLNLFASLHAESVEDFRKIFAEHKAFNGASVTSYLSKMTDGAKDRIGEAARLWSTDFPGDYLVYGYPGMEEYGYNHEVYVTKKPYRESKIHVRPEEQYKWAKRFAFRNFAKEHLYTDVKNRDDLKRMLDLPFMSMETITIIPQEKFPTLASSVHCKGVYELAKKVYMNERGKETLDDGFLKFIADVLEGRTFGSGFFSAMHEDLDAWFKELDKSGKTDDFCKSMSDFVSSFPGSADQKNISGNLVAPVLHSLKPADFERQYCSIFKDESRLRDDVLADKCIRDFTLEHVRRILPSLTRSKGQNIAKIIGNRNRELTFKERAAIFREFYPVKDISNGYEAFDFAHKLSNLCRSYAENGEEIANLFELYEPLRKKYGTRHFSYIGPRDIEKLAHPLRLRRDFGSNLSKHLEVAVALLNCTEMSPGIYGVLKIADVSCRSTSDVDKAFLALRDLREYACMPGLDSNWEEHLGSVLDKGMELSATEHGGDFDRIFDDLNRWSSVLRMTAEHSKARALFTKLNPILEERLVQSLKKYGRDAEDAVKVMNTIKMRRHADRDSKLIIDKAMKIKEELELGYDKNLVTAGFIGYFLQKKSGKVHSDLDEHLSLIKGLMPDPTKPRDAVIRELLDRDGLSSREKLKISDLLSDFKEKTEVQTKLYEEAVKKRDDYDQLSYREKVDLVKSYFTEPSRARDRVLIGIEKKYAQSAGETKYSGSLKFDAVTDEERKESTYVNNNKYLLDKERRAQAIAALSAGTLTKILLRYFRGPSADDKETSDEEKKIFSTIEKLEPVDRKRIIREMLLGLEAFEEKYLREIEVENRTGAFSIKAWKKEFIDAVIENIFKKEGGDDDFTVWLIREIFDQASVERSADIISELVEARTGRLTSEQIMFRFLKAGGPISRKLGQILSSNSLVPEKHQKELAGLKLSEESPIEKEQIIRIVRSDLDGRVAEDIGGIHVEGFGKLLGSASIRTVYKVKIRGKDYVAKINDPKARAMALEDLKMLDVLSKKLEASPSLKKKFGLENPRLLLHNLTLALFQDIDSRIELINSRKLEQVIHQEGNHTSKIFYAGPNVVLEECVDGKGIHKAIEEFGLDKRQVVDRILSAYAEQLDKGIFHADPHSENIMLTKSGEVYWIDKSMQGDFSVDRFSRGEKKAIFDILFDIGVFGRASRLHGKAASLIMEHLDEMARIRPEQEGEIEKLGASIRDILSDRTKGASDKFYAIEQAAEKCGYVFSDNVFMLGKSLITLSGEIKKIDPGAEIGDYLKGVFLKDLGRRAIAGVKSFFTGDDKEQKGILEDSGISALTAIDWNQLRSGGLISDRLMRFGLEELKGAKSEEDVIGRLKYIFLKYGEELTVEDIYFLMNVLKSREVLKALRISG